jgi:hypothetical protein
VCPLRRLPTCHAALDGRRPHQQRQRRRGQQLARPSAHRLRARGRLLPRLDGWRTGLSDLANLDATLDALIAASQDASGTAGALGEVERTLPDCQRKLARYRVTLDAGAMISAMSVQLTARQ